MSLTRSDDEVLLIHNPRCSKSRQLKASLEERGVEFTERRYLDQPLDGEELRDLAGRLGRPIQEWTRAKEPTFAELGLGPDTSEESWVAAVVANPVLLERPILVRGPGARVGRPPESALELLG